MSCKKRPQAEAAHQKLSVFTTRRPIERSACSTAHYTSNTPQRAGLRGQVVRRRSRDRERGNRGNRESAREGARRGVHPAGPSRFSLCKIISTLARFPTYPHHSTVSSNPPGRGADCCPIALRLFLSRSPCRRCRDRHIIAVDRDLGACSNCPLRIRPSALIIHTVGWWSADESPS